jgi:hypothetical protein
VEKITPIIEELKQLGSVLGNFPVVNPYKVPAGYFDEFPGKMFSLASRESLPAALIGLSAPYKVPAGYFDSLPDLILKKAIASSAGYQSPLPGQSDASQSGEENSGTSGEAELFDESVADELAGLSPVLSGIAKKTPFTVPDNYFNELSGNIIAGAEAVDMVNEELENLSPLMERLKPINVYSVPDEYFGELPGIVLNKVLDTEKTSIPVGPSVIALGSRVIKGSFGRRIVQYAAAAVITGLMITAGFFFANRNTRQQEIVSIKGLEEKAAQTSDEEILNYLATQHLPLVDSLINIDPEIKADAILEMLANVSDEELQQYLQLQSDTKILIN